MHNVESARMALTMSNYTDAAHVVAASDHCGVAGFKFNECADLSRVKLVLDGVVGTDHGIRVADSAAVMRYNVGNPLVADLELLDFAELVLIVNKQDLAYLGFFVADAVDGKAAFDIVQDTEVLSSALNRHDIYGEQ